MSACDASSAASTGAMTGFNFTEEAISGVKTSLTPLYESNYDLQGLTTVGGNNGAKKLHITEMINLNLSLSYALASSFYSFLSSNGEQSINHPIREDLDKIKRRIDRFRSLKGRDTKDGSDETPSIGINKLAAKRIIKSNIGTRKKKPMDEEKLMRVRKRTSSETYNLEENETKDVVVIKTSARSSKKKK